MVVVTVVVLVEGYLSFVKQNNGQKDEIYCPAPSLIYYKNMIQSTSQFICAKKYLITNLTFLFYFHYIKLKLPFKN